MTPPSCLGCTFHMIRNLPGRGPIDRCRRPQTDVHGYEVPLGQNGIDCGFETDSIPEPQRRSGDKCGADRIHYKPTEHPYGV